MDEQESPLERDHSLCVVLPGGLEKKATVHGSKPVMDLLVTLCASYRLNPSDYTVEVLSPNKNNISFKPNSPIGSLEAEKIVLKPKGVEEKNIRLPYMPEATVRLLINYNKSHKAVVRVSPRVPLEMLLPVVCDKCEFKAETTILLRDCQSEEPLDMNKTLNEHGLREVFARDTADKDFSDYQQQNETPETVTSTEAISPTPLKDLPKREKKQKENTGFLSLFRRKKKKNELERAASAPASPGLNKQMAVSVNAQALSSCNNLPVDMTKKRRAPQPPMGTSQSVPNNLGTCHVRGIQRCAESSLGSTKRRAPPPPWANSHPELQEDTQVKGTVDSMNTLEELRESDESDSVNLSLSSSSSPCSSKPQSSSSSSRPSLTHLHEAADPYPLSLGGKDKSDARCALANILMSSISKGVLVKRLRNSASFPKFHSGSSPMPVTRQCPDNGVFYAELESVLNSKLPDESAWEDPVEKKGMTTFKVVPLKKESQDPRDNLDAPDQCQKTAEDNESEASPENNQTEAEEEEEEEEVCSPTTSETETPLPNQEAQASDSSDSPPPPNLLDIQECPPSPLCEVGDTDERLKEEDEGEVTSEVTPAAPSDHSEKELPSGAQINSDDQSDVLQSPNKDMDIYGSYTDDKEVEEEVVLLEQEEEDDMFPPPPPPVFFNEDPEVMEEPREDTTSSLSPPQPATLARNGQIDAFSEDHRDTSSPTPPVKMSAASSRFAQAVALAVQRSRLQRQGKPLEPQSPSGPQSTLPSTRA